MRHYITLLSASLALAACSLTEGGSPNTTLTLGVQWNAPALARVVVPGADSLLLDKALLSVREVKVKGLDKACKDDSLPDSVDCLRESVQTGPFAVDLLTKTTLDLGVLPQGVYSEVKIKVEKTATQPYALSMAGLAGGKPFRLDLDFDVELSLKSDSGLTAAAGANWMASWNATEWWTGLDINACRSRTDALIQGDTLIIDEKHDCDGLESQIKRRIENTGKLALDED